MIQTELQFVNLYEGQPSSGQVDQELRLHAAYHNTPYGTADSGGVNAVLGAFLVQQLGLSVEAVAYVTRQSGPQNLEWINPDDARRVGIEVVIFESVGTPTTPAAYAPLMPSTPTYTPATRYTVPAAPEPSAPVQQPAYSPPAYDPPEPYYPPYALLLMLPRRARRSCRVTHVSPILIGANKSAARERKLPGKGSLLTI